MLTLAFIGVSYHSAKDETDQILEAWKAALLGVGGLGVISTIILSIFNAIEDRHLKIIENTYKHITQWDDPHLAAARKFTRKLKEAKPHMSDTDFLKHINDDEELRHSIVLVCNYFEQVRISHLMNRIDIKIFNKCLGPVMEDYNDRLKPYVANQGGESLKDWEEIRDLSKIK
jgi:hypothetical protein